MPTSIMPAEHTFRYTPRASKRENAFEIPCARGLREFGNLLVIIPSDHFKEICRR